MSEDAQTVDEKGVQITVEDTSDELEGWDKFQASARNSNSEQRTVNGSIQVLDEADDVIGECTVYLEIPGGEAKTEEFTVKIKEGGVKKRWNFRLVKVYDF